MAHTPGPWWVDGPGEGIEVHDTFGRTASVWGEGGAGGEAWDNARLIAAAPELLAALRAARDDLSDLLEVADLTDEGVADTTAVLNQVIAAIAKAEGRGE